MYILPKKGPSSKRPAKAGSTGKGHRPDCYICRKQDGIVDPPVGGYAVEGKHFVVEHAPLKMSNEGTVIIESRRHLLDFAEMSPAELSEFGSVLKQLVPAVKAATGAHRVYFLALMEHVAHFHLWLIPKKKGGKLEGVPYLMRTPGSATRGKAEAMVGKIRKRFGRS